MQRLMTTGTLVVLLVALLATGALAKNIRGTNGQDVLHGTNKGDTVRALKGQIRYSAGVRLTCYALTAALISYTAAMVLTGSTAASAGTTFTATLETIASSPRTAPRTLCTAALATIAPWWMLRIR